MVYLIIEYKCLLKQKSEIELKLPTLASGYISKKTINGKMYYYLQQNISGKVKSKYLKNDEIENIKEQLAFRKEYEALLPTITKRMAELEKAANLIKNGTDRTLMLLKLSYGMDALKEEQKIRSISFANTLNSIEGVPVSRQTASEIKEWQNGKKDFLSVFTSTLKRYGFSAEV